MNYSKWPDGYDIWEPIPNIVPRTDLSDAEREAEYEKIMAEVRKTTEELRKENALLKEIADEKT